MNSKTCFSSDLIEVFRTDKGVIFQSDRENCLFVDFGGKIAKYSISCLQRLRSRLKMVDIHGMLSDSSHPNFELVTISLCDHCYLLSVVDCINFLELLEGTFVMFNLNNILKDRLQRVVI